MSSIIRLKGSSRRPKSTCNGFRSSQFKASSLRVHPFTAMKMTVSTKPMTMALIEIPADAFRFRSVNSVMVPAASSGRNRISQGNASSLIMGSENVCSCLKLHFGQVFHVHGLALAIKRHDQRETHGDFGGGDGDDEKDKHLAVEVVGEMRAGDQREVRRVEHQFERHVNDQHIAPDDYA